MGTTVKYNLLKNALDLQAAEKQTYSRVTIVIAEDDEGNQRIVTAGNDSGEELVIDMPQCANTQTALAAANNILASMRGFQYQPFTATGAILDPAAEAGDAVSINGIYSGIYNRNYSFSPLMAADLSAPQEEDVDHEFSFEAPTERQYKREIANMSARFRITASQITAEVERATLAEEQLSSRITQTADSITSEVTRATAAEGNLSSQISQQATEISAKVSASGGSAASFSWSLTASGFTLKSKNKTVMSVNANGATVEGTIRATAGTIGGFSIGSSAIYNGMNSLNSGSAGVYVGTNGIAVGGGAFKVTSNGAVSANNMTLTGSLNIGGQYIDASILRSGADLAYSNAEAWGRGAGYGDDFYNSTTQYNSGGPWYFNCSYLFAHITMFAPTVSTNNLYINGYEFRSTASIRDTQGNYRVVLVGSYVG